MIYGPAFYKLLGIPETVAELTAYHLLGLDPRMITEDLIDQAITERKARLRQNIPGPQFIPIVSMIESELEAAADVIRDPSRRLQYNKKLLDHTNAANANANAMGKGSDRRKIVAECRSIVRSMVDSEGQLAMDGREKLAVRLRNAGMSADDVRYVLGHIPSPPGDADETSEHRRSRQRAEVTGFFIEAINLWICNGLLIDADEQKLLALAERLGIDADVARVRIDERIEAAGASRGERDESSIIAQFKLDVLAMYPMGDATELDCKRLLSLGAAAGLSIDQAREAIQDCLRPMPGVGDTSSEELAMRLAEDPDAILTFMDPGVPAGATSAPAVVAAPSLAELSPPGRPGRWGGLVVAALVMGMLVLVSVVLWPQFSRWGGNVPTDGDAIGAGELDIDGPGGAVRFRPPGLLIAAMAALPVKADVRKLLDDASPEDRTEALASAANIMFLGGTPREIVSVEAILRVVLGCPGASPESQNAAVSALIARFEKSYRGGEADVGLARRASGLLASSLLLQATCDANTDDPNSMSRFADRCRRSWRESLVAFPSDPVNDPRRLAYAVLNGGSLRLYGDRADAARFAPVAGELSLMASDTSRPGAAEALAGLASAAAGRGYPKTLSHIARLALADLVYSTDDSAAAGRALAALATAMGLDPDHPVRLLAVDSVENRTRTAKAMRAVIRLGPGAVTTAPAVVATQPVTRPGEVIAPGALNAVLAFSIRKGWSNEATDAALLGDLAMTMLACSGKVARFTLHTDALEREMESVLAQSGQAAMNMRLTRDVVLSEDVVATVIASPGGLDPAVADQLGKDLRSINFGERLQAINRLERIGGAEAADVMLARLDELVQRGRSADFTTINRILRSLSRIDDPRLPGKLADMIVPAKTNYIAHCIVMVLLDGTGTSGSTDMADYVLPVNHRAARRKVASERWKALAVSAAWGPAQIDRVLGKKTVPQVAWKPDPRTEKLLATFTYYADITGRMLRTYKPGGLADPPAAPDVGPSAGKMSAPVTGDELASATELLADELTRLARAADGKGKFSVQLDMIDLTAKARLAACTTSFQAAAVRLDTAGRVLEVLVRQSDPRKEIDEALGVLRAAHDKVVASTTNVLDELRELAFHSLVLLEQIPTEGP